MKRNLGQAAEAGCKAAQNLECAIAEHEQCFNAEQYQECGVYRQWFERRLKEVKQRRNVES